MLACMAMLCAFTLLSLRFRPYIVPEHYYFLNDYMLMQSEAIRQRSAVVYEAGIGFNSMGHINMARTVDFEKKKITFNLGSGYALIK